MTSDDKKKSKGGETRSVVVNDGKHKDRKHNHREDLERERRHKRKEETSDDSSEEEEEVDDVSEEEDEDDVDSVDSSDEEVLSVKSTDILSSDPLYYVLSRLFITRNGGKNIADILEEINQKLSKS